MRFVKAFLLLLTSTLGLAQSPVDRITAPIESSLTVPLKGNLHGGARPEFDQGRVDGSMAMHAVSLVFKPSPAQQSALDQLLAQQQDRMSPNYHKWLTPAQFGDRFGLSKSDLGKVIFWLQSQGFTVTRIANGRNEVFFSGTAAQVESAFHTELHNYLVNGEMHFANATEPSVPAALSGVTLAIRNLHNFEPKPRARVRQVPSDEVSPHFTSHISGSHFLAPDDFATIYDVQGLYNATPTVDGTGQTIAVIGQSAISLTDVHNFRSAAGLPAKDPTLLLVPSSGNSTTCPGDEGESDLDVEWTGGIAKNASIILVYVGVPVGQTCANRTNGAFDALTYAVKVMSPIAPIISISYGLCENSNSSIGITQNDASSLQTLAQQANSQGQTITSASGDNGAADCEAPQTSSAVQGPAVDIPAAIPEVTGVGGTEFN
jgi:subtilase family serine protease